jgi:opacity protein-like surface antigen
VDRQIRVGTGIQYDWSEALTVGAAYEYFDNGKAKIGQEGGALQGPLKGDFNPAAGHFLALNLIWRF